MISDLFWDGATSDIALATIGAISLAALAVAHVPLLSTFIPQLKPWVKVALLVQVLGFSALAFLIGFRVSDERAETRQLKNDLAFKELQLDEQKDAAIDAERLKQEAEARANEAQGKLNEFRDLYGDDPASICNFTDADLERLRALIRPKRR